MVKLIFAILVCSSKQTTMKNLRHLLKSALLRVTELSDYKVANMISMTPFVDLFNN